MLSLPVTGKKTPDNGPEWAREKHSGEGESQGYPLSTGIYPDLKPIIPFLCDWEANLTYFYCLQLKEYYMPEVEWVGSKILELEI